MHIINYVLVDNAMQLHLLKPSMWIV